LSGGAKAAAEWLGINRATLAVLAVIGCLGLSEELWSNFLALHLKDRVADPAGGRAALQAAVYIGVFSSARNLLEGFGYMIGGAIAHRLGARVALAVSAVPMVLGFMVMLVSSEPWVIVGGALLMTNWEPLSVPATFDIVGSEVPKNRRTIAFAVQSIQKRLPKMIGPALGGAVFAAVGYWLNLTLAFVCVGLAVVIQLALTRRMRPKPESAPLPLWQIARAMPDDLKRLLRAEILIRWGDWFARDFAILYVATILTERWGWSDRDAAETSGYLLAIMAATALATYVPMAKWVDRSRSPRPFIGLTFLLFALFPLLLVLLPEACARFGAPVMAGLVVVFVVNGLRELGEPARKALISTGFPPEIRARAIGVYWGLRSFAFFPAPLVAAWLWNTIGADRALMVGGLIGLSGTAWYAIAGKQASRRVGE
jgi:hypothetical protein